MSSALYEIEAGMFAIQNAENLSESAQAGSVELASKMYSGQMQAEEGRLAYDAGKESQAANRKGGNPEYWQEQYSTDSQQFQAQNNIVQSILSQEENAVNRTADSISQVGNMFKSFIGSFFDYITSLIAQG